MIIQSKYRVDIMETIQPTSMHTMMIQGDAEANRILLEVYQGGLSYDLTGSTCVATVIRADYSEVPITGTVSANKMYIDLPQEAYAYDGRIIIIMRNVQGQSDVSLFYGIGTVLIGAAGTVINPGGRIPTLIDLLAELDAMADATAAANAAATKSVRYDTAQSLTDAQKLQARENIGVGTGLVAYDTTQVLTDAQKLQARTNIRAADITSLAPAFLLGSNYVKGDVVHRYGALYRFTANHPAGAWTGEDVEETTVDTLLKSATDRIPYIDAVEQMILDAIGETETQITGTSPTNGHYWKSDGGVGTTATDETQNGTNYKAYAPIACEPGKKYKVNGWDAESTNQHLAVVVDQYYTILAVYGDHSESTKIYEFIIPESGAYILMTTKKSGHAAKCYQIELNDIEAALETDNAPTEGSGHLVKSGGVYSAIAGLFQARGGLFDTDDLDSLSEDGHYFWNNGSVPAHAPTSTNGKLIQYTSSSIAKIQICFPGEAKMYSRIRTSSGWQDWVQYVTSAALTTALAAKQDTLTFDNEPTQNSANPVKSGGVYAIEKTILDAIGEHDSLITGVEATEGHYWLSNGGIGSTVTDETQNGVNYKAYDPVSCNPGEKYKVKGTDSTSERQHLAVIVDADYKLLASYGEHTGVTKTYEFVIPADGAYILMTTKKSGSAKCYRVELNDIPTDVYAGRYEFTGKNIAIIGDSISTNGDWSASNELGNVPEIVVTQEDVDNHTDLTAYVTLWDVYKIETVNNVKTFVATEKTIGGHTFTEEEVGTEVTISGVNLTDSDVGKTIGKPKNNNAASVETWWEVAQKILGFNVTPVCWSGSSITEHEENVKETAGGDVSASGKYVYKCAHAWHESQIRKCGVRTPGTMLRTAPDMVIIYRGTNDLSHSPYSHITDYMDSFPTDYPESDTYDVSGTTMYDYAKGMRMLIKALRDAYPAAKIVLCTLNYFRRLSTTSKWTSNPDGDTWQKYNDMIRRIAEHEGCELIDFAKDGLNWANAANGYYQEGNSSTARWTHPNTAGHKILGNRALRDMQLFNSMV